MLIGLQPIALLIITGIMERRIPAPNSIIGSIIACTGRGNPAAPITQKEAPSSADSVKTASQGAPLQQRGTFFRALRQSVHAFQRHSRLGTCSLPHTS